ncbi:MAG: hypothetical protein ACI9VS_002912 [Candidatus Binatia bacterium]|jgi:hypothetical protein
MSAWPIPFWIFVRTKFAATRASLRIISEIWSNDVEAELENGWLVDRGIYARDGVRASPGGFGLFTDGVKSGPESAGDALRLTRAFSASFAQDKPIALVDIEGEDRRGVYHAGCDHHSDFQGGNRPLTKSDVGPGSNR